MYCGNETDTGVYNIVTPTYILDVLKGLPEIKNSDEYYGELPDDCTREKLVQIIAGGIQKYKEENPDEYNEWSVLEISLVFDRWCREDENLDLLADRLEIYSDDLDFLRTVEKLIV